MRIGDEIVAESEVAMRTHIGRRAYAELRDALRAMVV